MCTNFARMVRSDDIEFNNEDMPNWNIVTPEEKNKEQQENEEHDEEGTIR